MSAAQKEEGKNGGNCVGDSCCSKQGFKLGREKTYNVSNTETLNETQSADNTQTQTLAQDTTHEKGQGTEQRGQRSQNKVMKEIFFYSQQKFFEDIKK